MNRYRTIFALIVAIASGQAVAADDLPWKFNMSPEKVESFTQLGPYKAFSNGDLETYNATFDGKKENFQFFFSDRKLRRMGIYMYEGQDEQVAAKAWLDVYRSIVRHFGKVETPQNSPPVDDADSEFLSKAV